MLAHFSVGEDMAMEVRLELSLMFELTLIDETENNKQLNIKAKENIAFNKIIKDITIKLLKKQKVTLL